MGNSTSKIKSECPTCPSCASNKTECPSCPETVCPECSTMACPSCPETEECPGCPECPETEECPGCPECPEETECPTRSRRSRRSEECPVCPEETECPGCPETECPETEECPGCPEAEECPGCPTCLSCASNSQPMTTTSHGTYNKVARVGRSKNFTMFLENADMFTVGDLLNIDRTGGLTWRVDRVLGDRVRIALENGMVPPPRLFSDGKGGTWSVGEQENFALSGSPSIIFVVGVVLIVILLLILFWLRQNKKN
jgi:hypothetical protein